MAPQEENLAIGDTVTVFDMPEDSGLNGFVGTLLKPVGRNRWSLKVEGDDKSKVVPTPNLKKVKVKGTVAAGSPSSGSTAAPGKYSIVGTWVDWEPQAMTWNSEVRCFEFKVVIGSDGSESFKILKNGDWDGCVYPNCKDATPHDDHELKGPDDGGLNEDWTIGVHANDKVTVGGRYKVKLHVSANGTPTRVDWENLSAKDTQAMTRVELPGSAQERQGSPVNRAPGDQGANGGRAPRPQTAEEIVEAERKARERLAERFAAAAEASPLAILDEDTNWVQEIADREKIDRMEKVEANKQRYRRSVEEATRKPGEATTSEVEQQMQMAVRQCMECGKMSAAFFGNGVCETCWTAWEKVQKKGENVDVIPNHLPAGLRIYLRMKNSQMNTADGEPRPVRSREPSRSLTPSRRKARGRRAAAKAAEENDEDWDPFAPAI